MDSSTVPAPLNGALEKGPLLNKWRNYTGLKKIFQLQTSLDLKPQKINVQIT